MEYKFNLSMSYQQMKSFPTITSAEISQDLSIALGHFRQVLKKLLQSRTCKQSLQDTIQRTAECSKEGLFELVIDKYRQMSAINQQFNHLVQRLMQRIKQLLRNFSGTASCFRAPTNLMLRCLQIQVSKALEKRHLRVAICSILEFIDSFTSKIIQNTSNPFRISRDQTHSQVQKRTIENVQSPRQESFVSRRETEAEEFMRNASKYNCIDVDMEYLRGRYFNLKNNQKIQPKECLNRNQYINQLISSFERQYEAYQNRPGSKRLLYKTAEDRKARQTPKTAMGYLKTESKNTQSLHRSKENNFINGSNDSIGRKQTIESSSRLKSISYREVYEDKLREFRNVRMKNVVICQQDTSTAIHNLNAKKLEFFKKSKEQTKYRYKYYNYIRKEGNGSNSCLKGKGLNPQLMFATLTYK